MAYFSSRSVVVRQFSRFLPLQKQASKKPTPTQCSKQETKNKQGCPCPPPIVNACKHFPLKPGECEGGSNKPKLRSHDEVEAGVFKFLTFFVCFPLILALTLKNIIYADHVKSREPYKPYDHMGKRASRYPWGDGNHGLLHNPCYNPVPGVGYEDDKCPKEILDEILEKSEEEKYK